MLKRAKKNILFLGVAAGNYRVCLPVFRLFRSRFPNIAAADTDICIEGYPRSGNTYFVSAFLGWNRGLSAAHHTHLAGSAKYALMRDIPTVILIRGPEDAVSSVLVWDGLLNTTVALASYIHFYHSLWKHREHFLALSFDEVTKQPDIACKKLTGVSTGSSSVWSYLQKRMRKFVQGLPGLISRMIVEGLIRHFQIPVNPS